MLKWYDVLRGGIDEATRNLIEDNHLMPDKSCKKCHGTGICGVNITFASDEICTCVKPRNEDGARLVS